MKQDVLVIVVTADGLEKDRQSVAGSKESQGPIARPDNQAPEGTSGTDPSHELISISSS
jgi:hypothetical protein